MTSSGTSNVRVSQFVGSEINRSHLYDFRIWGVILRIFYFVTLPKFTSRRLKKFEFLCFGPLKASQSCDRMWLNSVFLQFLYGDPLRGAFWGWSISMGELFVKNTFRHYWGTLSRSKQRESNFFNVLLVNFGRVTVRDRAMVPSEKFSK